tara:strand:+ start:5529 stop:6746 length:1218 start_codon:yes stop_codon:yes gene_type:complete
MKILIVSHFFWPENFRINDLANELNDRGHDVEVLTGIPNYPSGKWFEGYGLKSIGIGNHNGIKLIRVPVIPRFSSKKWQLALNYMSYVISAIFFGTFYCKGKYDVIFTYAPSPLTVGLPAIFFKWLKKAPIVFWVQDLWPEVFKVVEAPKAKIFYSTVSIMMKYIYKKSDLILVQSKGFIRYVKEQGAEDYKIKYFPNWAEELYVPMAPISNTKEQMLLPKNSFVAMFAGNIGAAQSLGTIVDAAIILKDYPISWVILGDGRKKQWLEEQISKEGLVDVIHTLGFKPMRTMPLFFSYADVLLVTLEAHEIMSAWIPGKLQSYLASGKPIIGALKGEGSKVINESKAGFSVEPGDSVNLARNVLELSRMDKKTREKMGNNALDYYNRNFNRETLINKLEKYFDEIK